MLAPGTKLGHYEIEDSIGAGGMGEVYRARDVRLDRTVAIKVLPSHLSENKDLRDRFDREARTISNLQHPNICALHDVGHEGGTDFLVMEHLEGETLADRLAKGPLSANELLPIAVQIASALEAAHKNGVVHRDLKPGNVILTRQGAKLLDFGLAKIAVSDEPTTNSTFTQMATGMPSAPLTEQGTIMGTFQYMAPEQLEGKEADARSDIFSFGALLYEMATGQKAFAGDSQASLIASIMTSQPQPITTIQPMTPPALDRLIRTALEKDPDSRWQTAHDVALQLKWIQEGGSELGVPKPVAAKRKGQTRTAWIVAALASLAAVAFAALYYMQPEPPAPQAIRFSIQAPKEVVSFGSPRISPDGTMIAFNGRGTGGSEQIWIRPLNANDPYPLAGTESAGRPFWSPDSRHVGFFAGSKLKRVPVAGGPPLTLCEFARGADGGWGKNFILFDGASGDSIMAVPVGGGEIKGATRIDRERASAGDGWPFFLPDGERFVFIRFISDGPDEVHLGRIGSMETKFLTNGESRLEYVHPGYLIYERGGSLLAHPFDAKRGEHTGDPFALTEGIGTGGSGLAHFSCSENGILIYTEGDDPGRKLVLFDREGRIVDTFGEPGLYGRPAISPDGKRLAYSQIAEGGGGGDIWIFDLTRRVPSRFTFNGASNNAVWSPDGSEIAYVAIESAVRTIMRKKTSGSVQPVPVREFEAQAIVGHWSRGGNLLLTDFGSDAGIDVASIAIDSPDSVTMLTSSPALEAQGQFSPDERYFCYSSNETGSFEVYLRSVDPEGGKWQVSTNGGVEAFWRADGREIFYLAPDRSLMAVPVDLTDDVVLGIPEKLFDAPVQRNINTRNRYCPTPDGQAFYCVSLIDSDRVPPTNVIVNWTAELDQR
ncbi:MAG: protein kinase [Gemmatimonadetes bacterium]|nr:protein kinase [Gemmatimonadota bacterium]